VYRIFIDEFGHDNLNSASDPKERYLCLLGVVLDLDTAHVDLSQRMDAIKKQAFGTENVVLHRREVINQKPVAFDRLASQVVRDTFSNSLLNLIETCDYTAIAILIDKKEHVDRYKVWRFQPYHYCLTAMMERYVMFLDDRGGLGDVMAEWRGVKPNIKLEKAYNYVYNNGTPNMNTARFRNRLSSSQLKIKKKEANVAGLQLADLLVNPAARDLICKKNGEVMAAPFGSKIVEFLYSTKYHRNWRGQVRVVERRRCLKRKNRSSDGDRATLCVCLRLAADYL